MQCSFCEAVHGQHNARGWIWSYWHGDTVRYDPVCPICQSRHLTPIFGGDYELRQAVPTDQLPALGPLLANSPTA